MTTTTCDLCGSSLNVSTLLLPVLRTHDGCDGLTHYDPPKVSMKRLDICEKCLSQSTNIYDDTIMGYGQIYIEKHD